MELGGRDLVPYSRVGESCLVKQLALRRGRRRRAQSYQSNRLRHFDDLRGELPRQTSIPVRIEQLWTPGKSWAVSRDILTDSIKLMLGP